MTSTITGRPRGPASPRAGLDPLRVLAGKLCLRGLETRVVASTADLAAGHEPVAELLVTNPAGDRGQVRVSSDGAISWTCRRALRADADAADAADAISAVLARPRQPAAITDGARHALTVACPLSCLARVISARALGALQDALRGADGGHPAIGHVLDLHRQRLLPGIRNLGVQGISQIDHALRQAGLPAGPYDPGDPSAAGPGRSAVREQDRNETQE
jgi:hypothetical protein